MSNPEDNIFKYLEETINKYIDQLTDVFIPQVKDGIYLSTSVGKDIELLVSLFNYIRTSGESDLTLQRRLLALVNTEFEITIRVIKDLFEALTGLRPTILENFETQVYNSSNLKQNIGAGLAQFSLLFNIDMTVVSEQVKISNNGYYVTVGVTTNIDPDNPQTPPVEAYFPDVDPFHTTNIAGSLDSDTSIMTLNGGPYSPGRKVNIKYKIIQDNIDYDTLEKLQNNLPSLQSILDSIKPFGIKTNNIQITKFINQYFQIAETLGVVVTDTFLGAFGGGLNFSETLQNSVNNIGFGFEGWGVGLFDRQNSPVTDSLTYTLEIPP